MRTSSARWRAACRLGVARSAARAADRREQRAAAATTASGDAGAAPARRGRAPRLRRRRAPRSSLRSSGSLASAAGEDWVDRGGQRRRRSRRGRRAPRGGRRSWRRSDGVPERALARQALEQQAAERVHVRARRRPARRGSAPARRSRSSPCSCPSAGPRSAAALGEPEVRQVAVLAAASSRAGRCWASRRGGRDRGGGRRRARRRSAPRSRRARAGQRALSPKERLQVAAGDVAHRDEEPAVCLARPRRPGSRSGGRGSPRASTRGAAARGSAVGPRRRPVRAASARPAGRAEHREREDLAHAASPEQCSSGTRDLRANGWMPDGHRVVMRALPSSVAGASAGPPLDSARGAQQPVRRAAFARALRADFPPFRVRLPM